MTPAGPSPVTVACSGHWLLGHDRIGPRVLTMIDGRYECDVDICDLGTSALALLDHLRGQDLLIVVDACVGRGRPGDVLAVEPALDEALGRETSVHQIGPVEALVVARHLHPQAMPARVLLLPVETGGLDPCAEAAACRRVVHAIDAEIGGSGSAKKPTVDEGRMAWQSKQSCNVCRA